MIRRLAQLSLALALAAVAARLVAGRLDYMDSQARIIDAARFAGIDEDGSPEPLP